MAYRFFDKTKPKPEWVAKPPSSGNKNTLRGWKYYNQMWKATPLWASKKAIGGIYRSRKPWQEVDHIVPLIHPLVCGLHCEDNLRVIDRRINQKKSNHYWPDSPFEQIDMFGEVIEVHQPELI